jgi:NitT/TauT family transport system substrate-binding protein
MFKKLAIAVILFLLALGIITGCAASEKTKETSTADEKRVIKIAEQYGLAYAPIAIMKEKKMLEEKDESLSVQWKTLSNTAAIREAMLVDDLDIGFMGIPPFMIAYNNKMDWKIFTGLSSSPLGLVVNDENIKR